MRTDKRCGIANGPNRPGDPEYIALPVGEFITMSLQTVSVASRLLPLNKTEIEAYNERYEKVHNSHLPDHCSTTSIGEYRFRERRPNRGSGRARAQDRGSGFGDAR